MRTCKSRNRTEAFTLVELLVVIAIIALLMSILMPALGRARKQAKAVMCQSNLHQWGIIFSMYAGDNDGYFFRGWTLDPGGLTPSGEGVWMGALRPYYKDRDVCLCPAATKRATDIGIGYSWGSTFIAWGVADDSYEWITKGDYGSYGINGFINNPPPELVFIHEGMLAKHQWRRADVKGAGNIPLFLDCGWTGGWPLHVDMPPDYEDQPWWATGRVDQATRFCINRHNGFVNSAFLDFSTRKVGLKELWRLKWHRTFDVIYDPPVWPDWMRKFKDYD